MKRTISSKGRVTVPAAMRARLGFRAGTSIEFEFRENGVLLRKVRRGRGRTKKHPIDQIFGVLKRPGNVDVLLGDMRGPAYSNEVVADLHRRGLLVQAGLNDPAAYPKLSRALRRRSARELLNADRGDR